MKKKILSALIFLATTLILVFFIVPFTQPPEATSLWTEGQYNLPAVLLESGNLQVNTTLTAAYNRENAATFNFETCSRYSYFKITVHNNNPGIANILNIELSNGDMFFMGHQAPGGTTHIIHATHPWPAGTHSVAVWAFDINKNPKINTGEATIQIITATCLNDITHNLQPPNLHEILTINPTQTSPLEATFTITNHSPYPIQTSANYFLEQKHRNQWRRLTTSRHNYWLGFIGFNLQPGQHQTHNTNWYNPSPISIQLAPLPPGQYRIIIPNMIWQWRNSDGIKLTQMLPLYSEFYI
ncbi:MAG: hypothetical protein FWC78_04520 [Defluviitaleaceae bacterium]|nr:hypothetical protein [Defluviitaleaceae bacterium]